MKTTKLAAYVNRVRFVLQLRIYAQTWCSDAGSAKVREYVVRRWTTARRHGISGASAPQNRFSSEYQYLPSTLPI
jgi:hypothetical protein